MRYLPTSVSLEDGLPPFWGARGPASAREFNLGEPVLLAAELLERRWYEVSPDAAEVMAGDLAQWLANDLGHDIGHEAHIHHSRRRPSDGECWPSGGDSGPADAGSLREYRLDLVDGTKDRPTGLRRLDDGWHFSFVDDVVGEMVHDGGCRYAFGTDSVRFDGPFTIGRRSELCVVDPISGTNLDEATRLQFDLLVDGTVLFDGRLQLRFDTERLVTSQTNDDHQPWEIEGGALHAIGMPASEAGAALWVFPI